MVSPETLRRYPFFGGLTDEQLKELSLIASEEVFEKGTTIFEECALADKLYLLSEGSVDLYYRSADESHPEKHKEFSVGEINPGEIFGTSALVEPYTLNATARASQKCHVIIIDAAKFRKLLAQDADLANKILMQVIKALKERLVDLRVQLAAI
jgi:CRP-like cAMP-binding protein